MAQSASPIKSSVLFVAHPGHELRLHGWLSRETPICMVLTTGSRSGNDRTRLRASAEIIKRAGGRCGDLFGPILDRDLYHLILDGAVSPFLGWIDVLSTVLVACHAEQLVIDGWQLYSVSHDLAHIMGRLAAAKASSLLGRDIAIYQYDVVPAALASADYNVALASSFVLSESELNSKLSAIADYPGIEQEFNELKSIENENLLRTESLFVPPPLEIITASPPEVPKYESYGEARRSSGTYKEVIRWRHVETIISQLMSA